MHLLNTNVGQTCWEPNQHQIFLWLWCGCKIASSIFVLHTSFPECCREGTKLEHRRKETTLPGTYWCKKPAAQTLLLLNKNVYRYNDISYFWQGMILFHAISNKKFHAFVSKEQPFTFQVISCYFVFLVRKLLEFQ